MAKQTRPARASRAAKNKPAKSRTASAAKSKSIRAARPTVKHAPKRSKKAKTAQRTPVKRATVRRAPQPASVPPPAPQQESAKPAAPRKPGFYEAVAVYERGVQALQRHDYGGAAAYFRTVLEKYPDERELLERARLYLRVCERETQRLPAGPKSPAELVYAATMALNAGDHSGAVDHLRRALADDPENDHAHYTMAMALGTQGRTDEALDSLRRAIALNPDNRGLARHDAELEMLRGHETFRAVLDTPPAPGHRRNRPRR